MNILQKLFVKFLANDGDKFISLEDVIRCGIPSDTFGNKFEMDSNIYADIGNDMVKLDLTL